MTVRSGLALAVSACVIASCTGVGEPPPRRPRADRPYVVSAVDYHFHDAHPSDPIALDRGLVVTNEGSNVHNVTLPRTDIDRNVRPGKELQIDALSDLFPEPGRYRFFCKFHADRGMDGVLIVVAPPKS